jgi:hypothetical protein
MKDKFSSHLAIAIDFKGNRIRIHRSTLRAIGNPEYIHLLINPEERTLAIQRSDRSDLKAYRLPPKRFEDHRSFEITSKALMRNLLLLCSEWQDEHLYHVHGEIIPVENIVRFNLTKSFIPCETRG